MHSRLIALDFDGTLADSFACFRASLNELAARHGFRALDDALLDQARGLSAREVMQLLGVPLWKTPRITVEMRRRMSERAAQIRLFPGVDDTLRQLAARGVRIAIATSNAEGLVRTTLGAAGGLVTDFNCGLSVFGKKRKLEALIASAGLRPEQALYVGDEIRDAQAAQAAGIPFRGVAWGYTAPSALQPHCDAPLLERPEDLLAV
ncbi:HAD hydrolase-like protein [Ralstonia pseudosolanacearum]|uniref:HAD hydrolase-like protein n=1 Tax=Ralstonia pseudosolanacearum TaxID=1310165 RepID=UPI002676C4B7|nr:HAD hydrolase-like protein [Ralstonia pseudosolanacearum]MDO3623210.1 HAD hydrolase-like protein [Ralstonia pseudosolanacearum]